jgi:hypothetical protein
MANRGGIVMKLVKMESIKENKVSILLAIVLVIFAILGRFLPHPANFTPVAAVAIFGGAMLPRRWALSLPLLAMIISDLFIGLHPLILFTWGSFAAVALLSGRINKTFSSAKILGTSLVGSILFFVVTNFGVWLQGKIYAMTFTGLIDCYYKALPFFRNTLMGDLVYVGLIFGLYTLSIVLANNREAVKE